MAKLEKFSFCQKNKPDILITVYVHNISFIVKELTGKYFLRTVDGTDFEITYPQYLELRDNYFK